MLSGDDDDVVKHAAKALGISGADARGGVTPELDAVVQRALAKHPADVVKVYLHSFNTMNESQWKNLETLLTDDARLQF